MYWAGEQLSFGNNQYGHHQRKEIDRDAVWASEARMGKRSRRARYRCRNNYLRLVDIKPWPIYAQQKFDPNCLFPKPEEPTVETEKKAEEKPATEVPTQEKKATEAEQTEVKAEGEKFDEKKTEEKPVPEKSEETPAPEKVEQPAPEKVEKPVPEEAEKPVAPAPEKVLLATPNKLINRKISHWRGDITRLEIDAVVNAANSSLLGGGGIDGAIHSAAGDELYNECLTLNGTPTGTTKITRAYRLPAKYILHTVGPRSETPAQLESCYKTVLQLVDKHNIRSIALCGISTGIFGYPLEAASRIACDTIRKWLDVPGNADKIDRIIFCTFLEKEERCYDQLLQEYFPIEADPELIDLYKNYVDGYQSTEELTQSSSSSEESEEEPEVEKPSEEKVDEADKADVAESSSSEEEPKSNVPDIIFGSVKMQNGKAVVEVNAPEFLTVYEDFYYQVTPVGKYSQLYIKKELKGGKFVIASTDPDAELTVHWQVRGEAW